MRRAFTCNDLSKICDQVFAFRCSKASIACSARLALHGAQLWQSQTTTQRSATHKTRERKFASSCIQETSILSHNICHSNGTDVNSTLSRKCWKKSQNFTSPVTTCVSIFNTATYSLVSGKQEKQLAHWTRDLRLVVVSQLEQNVEDPTSQVGENDWRKLLFLQRGLCCFQIKRTCFAKKQSLLIYRGSGRFFAIIPLVLWDGMFDGNYERFWNSEMWLVKFYTRQHKSLWK